MTVAIILFGALTLLVGIVIIIDPEFVFGFFRNYMDKPVVHILAVVIRLILGAFLIHQSTISRFPLIIEILGWISIIAAVVLAVMGRLNFIRLMSWALSFSKPLGRVGGIIAMAFGAFLIYAFV